MSDTFDQAWQLFRADAMVRAILWIALGIAVIEIANFMWRERP